MAKGILRGIVLAVAILLIPHLGHARPTCGRFEAMLQWTAGPEPFHGPAFAMYDGKVLIDKDAHWLEFATETCNAWTCSGRGGKLLLDFENGDTLILTVQHGVYTPAYVPPPRFGTWRATFRVVEGTGLFLGAFGLIVSQGPWINWIDQAGFGARFSGELEGTLCIPK